MIGLILLNKFGELHKLLQAILDNQPLVTSVLPPDTKSRTFLDRYLGVVQHMLAIAGTSLKQWLYPQEGSPNLGAVEATVLDFASTPVHRIQQVLGSGYPPQSYCLYANLPHLDQEEHQLLHDWHAAWREVRMQCVSRGNMEVRVPNCITYGCNVQEVFNLLQFSRPALQFSEPFPLAQQAAASLFGLSRVRAEAMVRRVQLASRGMKQPEAATYNLDTIRKWFLSMRNAGPTANYTRLALLAGLLLKGSIYIFEFPNGIFSGVTILGMAYDSEGNWVVNQEFVPQEQVDYQALPPDSGHILFHVQSAAGGANGAGRGNNWYGLRIASRGGGTDPDIISSGSFQSSYTSTFIESNQPLQHDPAHLQQYITNLNTFLLKTRMKRANVAQDGSCLYHAIGRVLGVTAQQVKDKILALIQRIKHKFNLNLGATDNHQPDVVEPYTPGEQFLLNLFGVMLDQLDDELAIQGLWNDFNMIILAVNAFEVPIIYMAPGLSPVIQEQHAELHIVEVQPARHARRLQGLPTTPVIFFEGTPHWDVALPEDNVDDSLLATTLAPMLRGHGLAATLLSIQQTISRANSGH